MVYGHPNGVNCVKGEIHNVLSVMRVNARWASTSRFKREIPTHTQSPLLRRFKELHVQLESVMDLSDVDTLDVLEPFVHVIESEKTSGIITGAAVSSLNKFLLYGLIPPDGLRATEAINRIALCVSRCRFEETHRDVDEMVLMKLMELLECCVRCEAGRLISGDNIWKMVHTCYSISCQPRASMHLCHTAENTLAHVILTVFDRIADMDPIVLGADEDETEREDNESEVVVPYGIPVLEQLLTFLSDLIKPKEKEDTTILGLSLINLVLETAGTGLGAHPSLVHVLQGNLSKYLLQNSETTELHVLSLTLRVVFNLFNSIKDHLKVQLEVFFTSVHMRIIDSPSCSDEQKELALESLLEFCREPALMLDLYINYDCDVHCTNLFEVLCKALARNTHVTSVAPDVPPVFNILNLLALEGLLAVLESIARRCPLGGASSMADVTGYGLAQILDVPMPSSSLPVRTISPMSSIREVMQMVMSDTESETDVHLGGSPNDQLAWLHTARERTAEVLQQRIQRLCRSYQKRNVGKQSKKRYSLAADKFHNEPKNWVAYAQQLGLLPNPVTAESVAAFFHTTPGLDKTKVGEYLGEGPEDKYPFHAQVRDAYVGMFDFKKTTLDQALRLCLSKFRLPGEAQKIDRMMETFSKEYYRQIQLDNLDQPLADADAAFILSFSIIMLNTDLHSDQIQRKMTVDEFVRNNRGINAGQDLPRAYLVALYNNLQANQIKMQTDVSDLNTDDAIATVDRYSAQWEGVLKRQQNVVGASFTSNASVLKLRAGRHEREMFRLILDTTTSSILTAFERTGDESTMAKAMDGIASATKIAIYFQMVPEVNKLIAALAAYFVEFAHGVMNGERVHLPTVDSASKRGRAGSDKGDSVHVILREEERQSGLKTSRTLRTLQLLFDVVAKYADCLRQDAWTSVVECILIFNELDIAPTSLVEMDDFVDSRGVPLPPAQAHLSPRAQQSLVAGVSGKTRERSRRLAERQAAHRQQRNLQQGASNVASGGFWDSLSSYLWSEDDDDVDLNYPLVSNALRDCVATCGGGLLERDAWFRMCRKLSNESCLRLLESLLAARDPFKSVLQHSTGIVDWMMQENAILALELGINLVLVNTHRFPTLWPAVHTYVARILHSKADFEMTLLVERVVVNVLRVCIRLFHDDAARPMLLDTLVLLKELEAPSLQVLSERLAAGLHMLVKANAMYMHDMPISTWETLFNLLGLVAQYPNGWPATLDALKQLVADGVCVAKDIVGLWTGVCMRLINQRTGLEVDALKLLFAVANSDAADGCWIDLMRILLSYLQDERPAVARTAWDSLYRSLMLPGHPIAPVVWKDCFEEIIYTLDDRSRSNGPAKDSKDLSLYSTTLLSKVFLYNIQTLSGLDCFHTLWLNVLRRLATKLALPPSAGTSVAALEVYETTLHALHNLLVVMTAEGIFERTSAQSQQDVLTLSYDLIRSVCPQVLDQLRFDSNPADAMDVYHQPTPSESTQVETPVAIEIAVETETRHDDETRGAC
ncbi:hypothetical protein SDRG_13059 [Saprolegnia diclina VS20]|uniref:SEC7 domain-containing protein n=1 Tax=Saprolegnia diclina (strain VS20) TaxID=1156394 RepID=T0Q6U2_SAPDV|nr:hypothetical protein SDRG_13059 [Saprolegnia diclina VS20]EQC29185.1 hypothetical protein SDRG_13059 [Saprolegnia diclina VS20]|eukprot:XP_008617363.1 hypothetical protein SDRG_13059 [Saprolegnia diclina VS20]